MWDYLIPSTRKGILAYSVEVLFADRPDKSTLVRVGIHKHNGTNKYFKERVPCVAISRNPEWLFKPCKLNHRNNEND